MKVNDELKVIEELEAEMLRASKAIKELRLALAEVVCEKSKGIHSNLYSSPKRAAAKRASMDLTRKLAEFRKQKVW